MDAQSVPTPTADSHHGNHAGQGKLGKANNNHPDWILTCAETE